MRWAFWRNDQQQPQRALPDGVGLPEADRPAAATHAPDLDADREPSTPVDATAGATPSADPPTDARRTGAAALPAPATDLDRSAVAAAGADLTDVVTTISTGTGSGTRTGTGTATGSATSTGTGKPTPQSTDPRALAAAATGVLAARLPALSGVDGAAAYDEPEDELLHAYAELLAGRAARRAGTDRDDLLAVAHLAAAAAAVEAAGDPALLLLAGVPAEAQLRAAAHLLAQTADDGAAPVDELAREVRAVFGTPG